MADPPPQFYPVPPNAVPDPPPSDTGTLGPPSVPGTQAAPQFTPVPPGSKPDQPYQGQVLPFSTNAQGNTYFDPHAGILGAALDAYSLPGDVWTGKQPTPYSGGPANDPALQNRITNLATFFPSTGAATRAGITSADFATSIDRPPDYAVRPSIPGPQAGVPSQSGVLFPGTPWGAAKPTGAQLKTATDAAYDAARANPTTIPSSVVDAYGQAAKQQLQGDPFKLTPKSAPKTFDALDELAPQGPVATYTDLEATRQQLSAIAKSNTDNRDPFAASRAINHLDNLIDSAFPEAAVARANAAAGARANAITGDLTQANTGILEKADTAAQMRARVKTLTQNADAMRGFSPEEVQALTDFSKGGGLLSTALDKAGRLIGSGGIVTAAAGGLLGRHYLGESGGELGAMIAPQLASTFKDWATQRASNQLDAIAAQIRSRSPLGQQMQGQMTPNLSFGSQLPYRAMPPSLLATPPPPQGRTDTLTIAPPQPAGSAQPLPPWWFPMPPGLVGRA